MEVFSGVMLLDLVVCYGGAGLGGGAVGLLAVGIVAVVGLVAVGIVAKIAPGGGSASDRKISNQMEARLKPAFPEMLGDFVRVELETV